MRYIRSRGLQADDLIRFRDRYDLSEQQAADRYGLGVGAWRALEQGRRPVPRLLAHAIRLDAGETVQLWRIHRLQRPSP